MLGSIKRLLKLDTEKRYTESQVIDILNGKSITTNTEITKEKALNIPAVATSIQFITSTIAGLPIKLYRRSGDSVVEILDDYRLKLLNDDTGDLLDSNQFKRSIITDMLLSGVGYAVVDRSGNRITGIYYVEGQYVNVIPGIDHVKKSVKILVGGKEYREYEILRLTKDTIDGVRGVGVLAQHSLLFNTMYNALRYENTSVATGSKRGFLKSARRLEKPMLDELKQAWRKLTSTAEDNDNNVVVLNEGISFEPASSTATENQLNELKKTNNDLVYNIFGLNSAIFSTTTTDMDGLYTESIKTGVLPVVNALNTALNKFLLLEIEKDELFFAIDVSGLLKGNLKDRYAAYDTAIKSGWLQVDEVRTMENLAPIGLNYIKLSLADVLFNPATKEIFVANTSGSGKLGDPGAGKEVK